MLKTKYASWIPHILVALWLIYLGVTIWQHVIHSVQPPSYDPITYMQKAANFWQTFGQGKLVNPLNLDPTVRPPGTILMSYPFGFTADIHGFLFRSVYLPILCIVAAVYISTVITLDRYGHWWVASIAFLFSSLPMFYHFDLIEVPKTPLGWGFAWGCVDNFQAGIAAVSTAATVRSLMTRSWAWSLIGAVSAALTLLIKPSGLMIMALIVLIWIVVVALERLRETKHKKYDAFLRNYIYKSAASTTLVYLGIIALCLHSLYLSRENISFARQALSLWREVAGITIGQSLMLFHQSSGEVFVLWVLGVTMLFAFYFSTARQSLDLMSLKIFGFMIGSLLTWSLGAWYWLVVQAGGTQIRYFFPFMLMGGVYAIPAALSLWPHAKPLIRMIFPAICFIPALNLLMLLVAGDEPSLSWQKMAGVSISVGKNREEVSQAYAFLNDLREKKKNALVYSFTDGIPPSVFENVGAYEELCSPKLSVFKTMIPYDWLRGFAVRIEELQRGEYILIRKYPDLDAGVFLNNGKFDSLKTEIMAFAIWLSTLNKQSGVEVVSEGRVLRLLRITDRVALNRAIDQFVSTHKWRPEFIAANQPMWWNTDSVTASSRKLAETEIGFRDIYKLHAVAIKRIDRAIKIEVWWEELHHEEENNKRYLFMHLVDSYGNILANQQLPLFPYNPPYKNQRWRYGELTFAIQTLGNKAASLALGVYRPGKPDGGFLFADKGNKDWGGRRILIPINDPPSSNAAD